MKAGYHKKEALKNVRGLGGKFPAMES